MKIEITEVEQSLITTALNQSYIKAYNELKFNAHALGDIEKVLVKTEIAITKNLINKIDKA